MRKTGLPAEIIKIKMKAGFSLIELIISLSLILLIVSFCSFWARNSYKLLKKQKEINSLLATSTNFLENLKTVPCESIKDYNNKTLANNIIRIKINNLHPKLYQIDLQGPSFNLSTFRYNHE